MGVKAHDKMRDLLEKMFTEELTGGSLDGKLGDFIVKVGDGFYWKSAKDGSATKTAVSARFLDFFAEVFKDPVLESNAKLEMTDVKFENVTAAMLKQFNPKSLHNFSYAIGAYFEWAVYRQLELAIQGTEATMNNDKGAPSGIWQFKVNNANNSDFKSLGDPTKARSAANVLQSLEGVDMIAQLDTAAKDVAKLYVNIVNNAGRELAKTAKNYSVTVENIGGSNPLGDLSITISGPGVSKQIILELKAYQKSRVTYFTLDDTNFRQKFGYYLYNQDSDANDTWVDPKNGFQDPSGWYTSALRNTPGYLRAMAPRNRYNISILKYYLQKGEALKDAGKYQKDIVYAGTQSQGDQIRTRFIIQDIQGIVESMNKSKKIEIEDDPGKGGIIFLHRGKRLGSVYIDNETKTLLKNSISVNRYKGGESNINDDYWITKFRMSLETDSFPTTK